ncbi:MAG: uroporphyrinogen-III synthase, partial [Alistipes sp.]|nr:uroporphyrinogen-III synthase [Alistipes sp.]
PYKPELPEALDKLNLSVDRVTFARTVAADTDGLDIGSFTMIALYSPMDVATLVEKFGSEGLPPVAVFGEATLRAALDAGLDVKANAPTAAVPSMAKAVDLYLGKLGRGEEVGSVEFTVDEKKEEFLRAQASRLAKKSRVRRTAESVKK